MPRVSLTPEGDAGSRLAHTALLCEAAFPRCSRSQPAPEVGGRRPKGSSFTLYFVGWNGLDDGDQLGTVTDDSGPRLDQGDWVWFGGI